MPHIITGEIRKDVEVKDGGSWTLFKFELSESFKNKQGEREYTNYRVAIFASTEGMIRFVGDACQRGKVVSVMCDNLRIDKYQADDGRVFVNLELVEPKIAFSQFGSPAPQGEPQQRQPRPSKAELAKAAQRQAQAQNEPPMNFDDDIPF